MKHSDLERQLGGGGELMRKLLQAHLDLRQPGKAIEPVRDAAGTTSRLRRRTAQPGKHFRDGGGDTHWLSSRRQASCIRSMVGHCAREYSLEVRRRVAIEAAKERLTRGSRRWRSLRRARSQAAVEELVIRAAQDFEAFYADRQKRARADPHSGPSGAHGRWQRRSDAARGSTRSHATRCREASGELHGTAGTQSPAARQTDGLGGRHLYRRALRAHARGNSAAIRGAAGEANAATAGTETRMGQPR